MGLVVDPLFKYFLCCQPTLHTGYFCGVWFRGCIAEATVLAPARKAGCKDYVLLSSPRLWYSPMAVKVVPVSELADATKTCRQ